MTLNTLAFRSDFRVVKVKACEAVKKSKKLLKFTLDDGSGTDRQILSGIAMYYKPEDLVGKTLVAIVNLPPEDDGAGESGACSVRGPQGKWGRGPASADAGRRNPRRREAVLIVVSPAVWLSQTAGFL